jgi:glycerophosphoryl diester phosphodiesterase
VNPLLNPAGRPVIAHRGASADAPENTLEAFRLAEVQGADAFEFDVRLSRDGIPVVMHDSSLQRTTGHSGLVADLTLAEIQAADAGAGYLAPDGTRPWAGRGVRAPALVEVLRSFPAMPMLIEIKSRDVQEAVASLLIEERAVDRCVVASFKPGAMRAFRRSPFVTGADRRDVTLLAIRTRIGLRSPLPRCRLYAVPWRWKDRIEVPRHQFIAEAQRHDCPVHVWTVDDVALAGMLWGRGANGIITNRPALMLKARGQWQESQFTGT